jgi:hypothetical protein
MKRALIEAVLPVLAVFLLLPMVSHSLFHLLYAMLMRLQIQERILMSILIVCLFHSKRD